MTRIVNIEEVEPGMKISVNRRGWESIATVYGLSPDTAGESVCGVYAKSDDGGQGEFRAYVLGTKATVLEEAPTPEPEPLSIVRLGDVNYVNSRPDTDSPWFRIGEGGYREVGGIPVPYQASWEELLRRAAAAGEEIKMVSMPVRVSHKVGDVLTELPEDSQHVKKVILKGAAEVYVKAEREGWIVSASPWGAKSSIGYHYGKVDGATLNRIHGPFTVVEISEEN